MKWRTNEERTSNSVRSGLDGVQRMLDEHPSIESGSSRIRVADFAGAAFEMELWAYVKTGDWAQFTVIRQDVILKITEIVEAAGTWLAAPTRLTYVTEARRVDGSSRRTEEDVFDGRRFTIIT